MSSTMSKTWVECTFEEQHENLQADVDLCKAELSEANRTLEFRKRALIEELDEAVAELDGDVMRATSNLREHTAYTAEPRPY